MVFDKIYDEIRKEYPEKSDEVLIMGIGGNTGSGKGYFSREFAEFLKRKGIEAVLWGNDLYQAQRSQKQAKIKELEEKGANSKDDWWKIVGGEIYHDAYDRELLDEHFTKLKKREDIKPIKLYNSDSGELDKEVSYSFDGYKGPLWILNEGVYLFHEKVKKHLNKIIILTTGKEELISDPKLGEISKERKVRFKRVYERGLERGYKVDFYKNFLPLDIHTAKYIRDNIENNEDIIIIDNSDFSNREVIKL